MIKSRNLSSHTYNEQLANEVVKQIVGSYHLLLMQFAKRMSELAADT